MKKVLVLGGGGFIGRNVVDFLVTRGDVHVTAADIHRGSNWERIENDSRCSDRFSGVCADFTRDQSFDLFEDDIDEVYMLAAVVGVNRTIQNPQEVIMTNTLLTINTLNWLEKTSVKKLLFASSSENYAGTSDLFFWKVPTAEDVPLSVSDVSHPRWTYAITKIHGEAAFLHSASSLGFESTVVRYQNIVGPEMGFGHAIPHIVERFVALNESPFKIYGHDQTRAFCFVEDAVRGTVLAMENSKSDGEIYHIGNSQEVTIRELTTFIGDLLGYKGPYEEAVTYPGSVSRRCPDISKATRELSYAPIFSWQEAVEHTASWYKEFFANGNVPENGGFQTPEAVMGNYKSDD